MRTDDDASIALNIRESQSTIGIAAMMLHQIAYGGRKAIISIAALLSVVALCMPVIITYKTSDRNISISGKITTDNIDSLRKDRPRGRTLTDYDAMDDNFDVPKRLPDVSAASSPRLKRPPIATYSLGNVLVTTPQFHDTFAVVVYDPPSDKFIAHYSSNMRWISGCHKLVTSFKILAHSLRMLNPDRFGGKGSPEFAVAMSSADYPGIKWDDCFRQQRKDCTRGVKLSPVLQFGSNFRRPLFPSMVTMPMPQLNHLSCYHYWAMHRQICSYYLPRGPDNPDGLVFPETIGIESWEELIPQVVWRGTDFSYLHKMEPSLRTPDFDMDVASQIDLSGRVDKRTAATHAIRQVYEELIPRWKGVVLTAEAEREAEELNKENRKQRRAKQGRQRVLPWANIKFAGAMYMGKKTPTSEIQYYQQFEEYGIPAIGEGMSLEELGRFRYHVDLGGGGGTTWSGTIEKLGLPGLLFHHVTPTKDYLHERLVPWVHYVPIMADLSDLKEKVEWAEAHPKMARRISEQATDLVRSWGTPEGFEGMFQEFFVGPLRGVVEAYRPLKKGSDWREEVVRLGGQDLRPIIQCAGYHHHDCERLVDDVAFTRLHDRDPNMST